MTDTDVLAVFAVTTVLFVAGVWMTRPPREPRRDRRWHVKPPR